MAKKNAFDFTLGEDENTNRHAYRAHVYGIEVRANKGKESYTLVDVSVSGCSFRSTDMMFNTGDYVFLQLEVKGRVILAGLEAKVVRLIGEDVVACSFDGLTEKQEYALDKLVLEIQKRIIALNRT